MNSFFKTIIAGYGAKKLGGGCFSTILIFVLIYVALGQCNKETPRKTFNKAKTNVAFIQKANLQNQRLASNFTLQSWK